MVEEVRTALLSSIGYITPTRTALVISAWISAVRPHASPLTLLTELSIPRRGVQLNLYSASAIVRYDESASSL